MVFLPLTSLASTSKRFNMVDSSAGSMFASVEFFSPSSRLKLDVNSWFILELVITVYQIFISLNDSRQVNGQKIEKGGQ